MQLTSKSFTPSHLSPIQQLQALHLLRAREKAGLSRAQMAQQTGFSLQDIENVESGLCVLDIVELDAWCRAAGTSLSAFARELEAALAAGAAEQEADGQHEQRTKPGNTESGATNMCLLCFAPDLSPKLLTVEDALGAIRALLGTTRVRVFATDSAATLGFCAAEGTWEETIRGNDGGEYTLLRPTDTFLVMAGEFEGMEVPISAPRNVDLSWAPLAAWVPLCPHTLDLAIAEDRKRFSLNSLSPLQVELVLDKFAPRLSDGGVEQIMGAHPDGAAWMADWND